MLGYSKDKIKRNRNGKPLLLENKMKSLKHIEKTKQTVINQQTHILKKKYYKSDQIRVHSRI